MRITQCRASGSQDLKSFLDLGLTPLADALVKHENLDKNEARFPLELVFCPDSALVQITEDVPEDVLFVENYLYFSSFSDVVLKHSREHAHDLIDSRGLDENNLVVELASTVSGYSSLRAANAGSMLWQPMSPIAPVPKSHQPRQLYGA